MALTIPPAFCTDQPYPFSILRKQMASLTSPGIVHVGDMTVSPASGLQVQIAAGEAYIQQTGATEGAEYNGLYYELNDAPANPFNTISAPLVNPRIDFVILRVYDVTELGISGSSFARFEWVQGSENASASLSTMGPGLSNPGAPALPASSLLRAYVLQPVGESSISSGNILNSATLARQSYASGTAANRPIPGVEGRIYRSTDSGGALEFDNGSMWLPIAHPVVVRSAGASMYSGQCVVYTGSGAATMGLPPVTLDAEAEVMTDTTSGVTGAAPLTVDAGSGVLIKGKGVSSRTIVLGTPGASVKLRCDGTSWQIVGGEQNTGWVMLTRGTSVNTGTGYPPAARLVGDRVDLCGAPQTTGTISAGATLFTSPFPPAFQVQLSIGDGSTMFNVNMNTSGVAVVLFSTIGSGNTMGLDGLSYRLV